MSGLTNTQTGAHLEGELPIQYESATPGTFVNVSAATPLPTTSSGGGGGASLIQFNKGTGPAVATTVTNTGDPLPIEGSVSVSALPSLPGGSNNIGDVDVASLPALPTGTNSIGNINTVSNLPDINIAAGTNVIGKVDCNNSDVTVTSLPALASGTNTIGKLGANTGVTIGRVQVATGQTIGLSAGAAAIGSVIVSSMPSVTVSGIVDAQATFVDTLTGLVVDVATAINRQPVSDRPVGTATFANEDNIIQAAKAQTILTCPAGAGNPWYQVRFAGIDRTTQAVARMFAFGVERISSTGTLTETWFPEIRCMPQPALLCSVGSFEPIADDFYLAPGDKLIVNSDLTGAFQCMIDYDIIA